MNHSLVTMSQLFRSMVWIVLSTVAASIIAWLAVGLQLSGRGPLGIVSLGIGIAVGMSVVGFSRMVGMGGRKVTIGLAMTLALATVAAEHTFYYREYMAVWQKHRLENPVLKIFRPNDHPKGFWTYMLDSGKGMLDSGKGMLDRGTRDRRLSDAWRSSFPRWLLWLIDLLLVVFSAFFVTFLSGESRESRVERRE